MTNKLERSCLTSLLSLASHLGMRNSERSTRLGSELMRKYWTRLKSITRDKHASLFVDSVTRKEKRFYDS